MGVAKMNRKKRIYDWISFYLSVAFVLLNIALLAFLLFAQSVLTSNINNIYKSIHISYTESQVLVKSTLATLPEYKKDLNKLIGSTDFFAEVGVDNNLKAEVIGIIDSLQAHVSSGQQQTTNLLQIIESLNGFVGQVNQGVNANMPAVMPDQINNLSNVLNDASTSLVELRTMARSANPSATNAQIAEALTSTVNDSLDTTNTVIIQVNEVVNDQFAQLTILKKSVIWWIKLSTILITILFAWAIYTGFELAREKYNKVRRIHYK